MDEIEMDNCEVVSVEEGGGSLLIEKIFLELEKNVVKFKRQRKLKAFEIIEMYMQKVDVP